MGREIRRVPKGWEHPRDGRGDYRPMHDEDYGTAIAKWVENHTLWLVGKHPDQKDNPTATAKYKYYAEWNGDAPDVAYYRPKWPEEERICFQVYETVSEGTPVTPVFETKEALAEHLVRYGDDWSDGEGFSREAAEAFVKEEWAPSMTMQRVGDQVSIKRGIESCEEVTDEG